MRVLQKLKSQLAFTHSEQAGILVLIGCIIVIGAVNHFWPKSEALFDMKSAAIQNFTREMDSLRCVALEASKPKKYPFNPNFISEYKSYLLGMSPGQFDRLRAFRDADKWIRSTAEFREVTGVSQKWLDTTAQWFKFPKPRFSASSGNSRKEIPSSQKMDINSASAIDLQQVYGIGKVYGERIIKLRNQLGGFAGREELFAVYGIPPATIGRIWERFDVKTPRKIIKKRIDQASASDIATIPGISFDLAVQIWEFARNAEGIASLDELEKIADITPEKIAVIRLYLSAGTEQSKSDDE